MRVSGLLDTKGNRVVMTDRGALVSAVASLLAEHRIGAVVVSTDGRRIDGVVSERDIVRALAMEGRTVLDRPVSTIMTHEVFTCESGTTVEQLMSHMTERRIRHVPVVDDGALIGIVSIGDVVKDRINDLESETQVLHEYIQHGR